METISLKQAHQLILNCQGLSGQPKPKGIDGTRQVIRQVGYIQIDTIAVIERAHHHILSSRVAGYQPAYLQALEEDRSIFEYWAHAASYLPMAHYRFSLPRKQDFQTGKEQWFKRDAKTLKYVLDRIIAEGPLMSKDFKPETTKSTTNGMDWARNPMNMALRQLFMQGKIMISGRQGFQKIYDIPERVLPPDTDTSMPSPSEYMRHLIERDLQAHGLLKAKEMGYLLKGTSKLIQQTLQEMVEAKALVETKVEGQGQSIYYSKPTFLESLDTLKVNKQLHILSPFDNLLIQRKRTEELFNFNYTLECYVPAPKRKVGYFSLPLLYGNQFVGQIDLKADRKTKTLTIKNLIWEPQLKQLSSMEQQLEKTLAAFAIFNKCEHIK
ncbi:MAG: crosslink repair DNA glycosylase YcaQ family protein [Saprospiraceae bacterium]